MTIDLPVFTVRHAPEEASLLAAAALRVIDSGRYVLGNEVTAFELEFAAACGSSACVGVASGSDALELTLRAAGVESGDVVVTVANAGYYATAAIRATGARPAFVDVGPRLVMTAESCARALDGAKALVVTHLYGRMAPVDEIAACARAHGVTMIEDCAQAHGAHWRGRRAGTTGAAGCFSFYPTKNLGALGDAGAIVTDDAAFAERLRVLRQHGWDRKYDVARSGGRNSRLDELQAAFLRVKLPGLAASNAARARVASRYLEGLRDLSLGLPPSEAGDVNHLFVVQSRDRDGLRSHLERHGIGTDIHYPVPDYRQPVEVGTQCAPLPRTEAACREVLSLPCFPGMSDADVDRVVRAIRCHHAECDGRR